ncbi:MAG TPA: hypothetical protein VHK90_07310 [Thermoanaerobaculia bacterium]|nr:hypothetical protein [Thermoanaerobaculia bacterium]
MLTIPFLAFVAFSAMVAVLNPRMGWLLALLCGVLQDPIRKMTPGTPVALTLSVLIVYAGALLGSQRLLALELGDFTRRFAKLSTLALVFAFFLGLAAITGLFTFGLEHWKVPALSLFLYCAPVPAVLFGYAYLRDEEQLLTIFRFYCIITSIALLGTVAEYAGVRSAALGMVAMEGEYIRHLPGIQIRMLSGIYRAPDIMAWHAATLTSISAAMAVRAGLRFRAWPWMLGAAWGFLSCVLSGRRKALYMVAAFGAVFVWRYFRRFTKAQLVALLVIALALAGVLANIARNERTSVYAKGTATTRAEIAQRLEGGAIETVRQFGVLGAGLGVATQGVWHLIPGGKTIGWQEGGLAKLTVELGVPGLAAAMLLAWTLVRLLLRIAQYPDEPETSQFLRVTLFALVLSNAANFAASAQAYSDAVLTLLTAFFLGCLLATAALADRAKATRPATAPQLTAPAPA